MTKAASKLAPASEEGGSPVPARGILRRWARVTTNRRVATRTSWLEVDSPDIARTSRPGQFLMLGFGAENSAPPFLPRPFSVGWRGADGQLGFLVRAFGEGTRRLAELRAGESLLLVGPLGRPFHVASRAITCVAGGVGLAPFLFLASDTSDAEIRLIYGERTGDRVFETALLESLTGCTAEVWTEDGSAGRKGKVLDGIDPEDEAPLLACGPAPMLTAVAEFARRHGRPLQVSVEAHMGCGIGTCQGCVVRGADGSWIKSCTEGPVFDAGDLCWETPGG